MATLILFLCLISISSILGYTFDNYVIGGHAADIKDFPYQVSIQLLVNDTFEHDCGGAIITEKFILTAAHCLLHPMENLTIFVGATKISGAGQTYTVEHLIWHAEYNTRPDIHDIGIIGVKDKIIFSKFVKPISLYKNNIAVGTMVIASGWGFTTSPGTILADSLQKLEVRVMSLTECNAIYKKSEYPSVIEDTQFCTLVKKLNGLCSGDSGGPLTLNGMLVGLISSRYAQACAIGKPDVNTKVFKYIEWINTTITEYCKTNTCPSKNLYPTFVGTKKRNRLCVCRPKRLYRLSAKRG